jgi:uncharacterized protein YndB with AHSA1/START domain
LQRRRAATSSRPGSGARSTNPSSAWTSRACACEADLNPAAYRFLDRWAIDASIERVYEVIGDALGYERWWTDFVLRASGGEGLPRPRKRNELLVKAYLPYKVNFGFEVIEAERPTRILSRLSKDFDGTGEWTLRETGGMTEAMLDWRSTTR